MEIGDMVSDAFDGLIGFGIGGVCGYFLWLIFDAIIPMMRGL